MVSFVTCLNAAPALPVVPAEIPPRIQILQPGVKLTLLAEHPDLRTPTGLDVDAQGNIWLVACHTHFRPRDYQGPKHDEILVFDRHGKNRRVFYQQTDATMQLKLGPDGWVYLAERSRILRVKDTDGDGAGDVEEKLAALDTVAEYPHNGLAGLAWHPDGGLLFSIGQNAAKDWTLTSKDGLTLAGRGEGGVFRCRADGTGLRRIARGFWNPFGLLVQRTGEIFAVDNDPGSRPPCRLLTIIEGADYGFQRVYGEAAVHPFVAWNGELRGTLGMIHPSGEGPSAVVELGGGVLVPSWSSHCLDYFPLARQGAGYAAQRVELLRGSDYFRPVCIAPGPDGSFCLTDWVFSAYEVHGRGRLWKLEIDPAKAAWIKSAVEPMNEAARLAKDLREGRARLNLAQLFEHARGRDAYLSDAALTALARESASWTPQSVRSLADQDRVWALVALRRVNLNETKWVRLLIKDPDPEVRFECLRWIADAVLTNFSADVERMLTQPDLDYRLFEAVLATWNTLRGQPGAGITDAEVLVGRVTDAATPARLKGYALRLAPATHPKLTVPMLRKLLVADDPVLPLEAVRTLAARLGDDASALLAEIAASETHPADLRAEAIAGLAASSTAAHRALLLRLATNNSAALRDESLRALRNSPLDAAARQSLKDVARRHPEAGPLVKAVFDPASIRAGRPGFDDTAAWLKRLAAAPGKPDVEAGRRIFLHSRVAGCASCHRHNGRGNVVGPDLSLIGRQADSTALLRSILEPDGEIAPEFYPTRLELRDGTEFTGILLRSSDNEIFRDLTGKERVFQKADIVERAELRTSLMPAGLVDALTDGELRDLLAFLSSNQ
jgi:putative membrane-bound dehydrogenase-like protein